MEICKSFPLIATGCLLATAAAYASPLPDGRYVGKVQFDQSSMEMALSCAQAQCQLDTTFVTRGGQPSRAVQTLKEITPVEDLSEAQSALDYARSQKSAHIDKREFSALIQHLQPLLNTDLVFDKCYDVHVGGETYSLVCTTPKSAWEKPSVLYLGSLLANCGEGFCRYVIYPLIKQEQ